LLTHLGNEKIKAILSQSAATHQEQEVRELNKRVAFFFPFCNVRFAVSVSVVR
jgi:hypothetical protein